MKPFFYALLFSCQIARGIYNKEDHWHTLFREKDSVNIKTKTKSLNKIEKQNLVKNT